MVKKHMGLRGRALHTSLLCTAVLPSYLLYGYNQAVCNGLLTLKSWLSTFPEIDPSTGNTVYKSNIQGTTVAIYTAAGIFGCLFCVWSGDRYGRKKTIVIGAVTAGIGALLQATSFSLAQLIVGRVIAGLGNGGIVATVPNLQAETASPSKRGAVVQWLSVFALAGLATASWIELGIGFTDPDSVAWRFPMALPILFVILIIAGMTFAPESPRWLVYVGRVEEAREVIATLEDTDPHGPEVNTEIAEIQGAIDAAGSLGFRDAFKMGPNRYFHRTAIACCIQIFQQLTGVNCLAYYQKNVFLNLNLNSVDAGVLAASVFTFSTLVTPIGVFTVDRFGRRPLMLISAAGNAVCLALVAGCSSSSSTVALGFACLGIFGFFFFFPIGFLGVTFLYAAEVSPLSLRVPITAMSTACVWAFNFLTVEVTPVGVATISYYFYVIWAVMNALIFVGVYFFFPETKGLSLESTERIFTESNNVFESVWISKKLLKQGGTHIAAEEKLGEENGVHHHDDEKEYEAEKKEDI